VLLEIQLRGVGGNQLETQSNSSWGISPGEDTPKGRNTQRKKGRREEGEKARRGEGEKPQWLAGEVGVQGRGAVCRVEKLKKCPADKQR